MPWWGWLIVGLSVATLTLIVVMNVIRDRKKRPLVDHGMLPGLLMWPEGSVPFMVLLDTDIVPTERLNDALDWALTFWRDQVSPELFAAPGEVPEGGKTIPIMDSEKWSDWPTQERCTKRFGYTNLIQLKDELWSAAVYIDTTMIQEMADRDLRRGIAHELGHVLGLAHDDMEESIMYHSVSTGATPIVTEGDITMLRALYA